MVERMEGMEDTASTKQISAKLKNYKGIRRYLNPFKSTISRVMDDTRDDPVMRKRILWSLRGNTMETGPLGFIATILIPLPMIAFMCDVISYNTMNTYGPLMSGITGITGIAMLLWGQKRERVLRKAIKNPAYTHPGRSLGWPELDAILAIEPFQAEHTLLAQGVTAHDIASIGKLATVLAREAENHRVLADGMLEVVTTKIPSPEARSIVNRASAILVDGLDAIRPQLGHEASLTLAMQHAGIAVHRTEK